MGYTTNFSGGFTITPPLKPEHQTYLEHFARTRRMNRDIPITRTLPDPIREAAGLSIGDDAGYYVGGAGEDAWGSGTTAKLGIRDYNRPPSGQPGLWCQWTPGSADTLVWDGGEKFYDYDAWLQYLINHFFRRWGYSLNGTVMWRGEDHTDIGKLIVKDNDLRVVRGEVREVWPE